MPAAWRLCVLVQVDDAPLALPAVAAWRSSASPCVHACKFPAVRPCAFKSPRPWASVCTFPAASSCASLRVASTAIMFLAFLPFMPAKFLRVRVCECLCVHASWLHCDQVSASSSTLLRVRVRESLCVAFTAVHACKCLPFECVGSTAIMPASSLRRPCTFECASSCASVRRQALECGKALKHRRSSALRFRQALRVRGVLALALKPRRTCRMDSASMIGVEELGATAFDLRQPRGELLGHPPHFAPALFVRLALACLCAWHRSLSVRLAPELPALHGELVSTLCRAVHF